MAPLATLIGRSPSVLITEGALFRLIAYSKVPIFCVPTGMIRFCAARALATSWPERPRARIATGSMSIWT